MPANPILSAMLQRLFAAMAKGPNLNCRPHASRLRIDLAALERMKDANGAAVLESLLGAGRSASVTARVPMPAGFKVRFGQERFPLADVELFPEGEPQSLQTAGEDAAALAEALTESKKPLDPAAQAWLGQRALLTKLRNLSEEARTYEQDTGVHALHIGYPLLSLPPGILGAGVSRVLAPIAFIPISVMVRTGHKAGIDLACYGHGVDLVVPNLGLMAWLERQTGKTVAAELFIDELGERPWDEVEALVERVCTVLGIKDDGAGIRPAPEKGEVERGEDASVEAASEAEEATPAIPFAIEAIPKTEELAGEPRIYRSAVLGLFPMTHESLLRDTQAMLESKKLEGPVMSFIDSNVRLEVEKSPPRAEPAADDNAGAKPVKKEPRQFRNERLVAAADPCQSRTVAKARQARGLVIHGPPGTGKSQTITNIIGDHLARGERVLFVCDKRTALDVVFNRLDHLGLGGLCALVHDPQRDQRDLYMAIRNQLEGLAEVKTNSRAARELEKIDDELQRLHGELTAVHDALMTPDDKHGTSFHELMGQWLSIDVNEAGPVVTEDAQRATLDDLERSHGDIEVILRRGLAVKYVQNAWVAAVGIGLDAFLARPAGEMRRELASCVEDARAADATRHEHIPPFNAEQSLAEQMRLRGALLTKLKGVMDGVDAGIAKRVSQWPADRFERHRRQLHEAGPQLQILREGGASDAELALITRDNPLSPAAIAQQLGVLSEYLAIAGRWHAFLQFGVKSRAAKALRQYGLPLTVESAQRARKFLLGIRSRQLLLELHAQLCGESQASQLTDEELERSITQHAIVAEALTLVIGVEELESRLRRALEDQPSAAALLDGLERSGARGTALEQLEASLRRIGLFDLIWLGSASAQVRSGRKAGETLLRLQEQFDTVEDVIRIRHDLGRIAESFRSSVETQLRQSVEPEMGLRGLRRSVLAGEIARRLAGESLLRQIDAERLGAAFDRYRQLETKKRTVVRDVILHQWRTKQKERLLVSTGTRLNGEGAKLRQRLFVRGRRAMRLRQVVAIGRDSTLMPANEGNENPPVVSFESESTAEDGAKTQASSEQSNDVTAPANVGDPLFDLCPVWMASPATVSQIFPLQPMFDVVVFDEASQCKLEEALPVLTRAKRLVVAGDPKQLPPTRFFEASISESDHVELESDQDLFEAQQGEIEDLLAASLNLEIEEGYLDVHYRSRNADLIEFSNQQFYGDRLQAIPGHPANRTRYAPITLYRADGVYERRCNPTEARRVCEIVRDLLKRADPPSIGIACFNLTQRDLILEMLDDLALEDSAFAARLAEARERKGESSFEGLFVKNLENVQGDERDHIIISTTYGPNPAGKFYRRFGPLGMPGGGRRLNVLVTRARHEVHVVTSIPREAYVHMEPIPQGQTPNGAWLLFAYLRYAEGLAAMYEQADETVDDAQPLRGADVLERAIEPFSPFCLALGRELAAAQKIGSDVHWGNEGFRIDLSLHHPRRVDDVTIGVLCDFTQFARAQDAVEWDLFRTGMHESQGWRLHRLWTPQYFRDSQRAVNGIVREMQAYLASEPKQSPREV